MPRILQNHYVLAVQDARQAAKFFVDVLDFRIVGEPDGWVFVHRDSCMIMLGQCRDDMLPADLGSHNYFAYLVVDDVGKFHARIKATGVDGLGDIEDKSWNMREFSVRTPEGHRLMIGQVIDYADEIRG